MINKCIGCYYHDSKENVCTHGSPIFLDDICTDYQDNEFVKQIRAAAIDEIYKIIEPYIQDINTNEIWAHSDNEKTMLDWLRTWKIALYRDLEQLKVRKNE